MLNRLSIPTHSKIWFLKSVSYRCPHLLTPAKIMHHLWIYCCSSIWVFQEPKPPAEITVESIFWSILIIRAFYSKNDAEILRISPLEIWNLNVKWFLEIANQELQQQDLALQITTPPPPNIHVKDWQIHIKNQQSTREEGRKSLSRIPKLLSLTLCLTQDQSK